MSDHLFRSFQRTLVIALPCATMAAIGVVPTAAHGVLVFFSAQKQPVPAQKETAVTLRFNDNIEVPLSRVLLVGMDGRERPLKIDRGDKPNKIVVHLPPLSAGTYGLRYKMLAADGHISDEIVRLSVSADE